tara:strand:+ start:74 stop:376 length:303 start_codon:yes stop_codon:yes gene_type:complete
MDDIQLKDAMFSLRPNRSYAIRGGVLEWYDTDVSAPAQSEIDAEILKLQAEYDSQTYSRARAKEYPDYRIYLDGVVKGDDTQKQKYIDDCKAVKLKYPKN